MLRHIIFAIKLIISLSFLLNACESLMMFCLMRMKLIQFVAAFWLLEAY